MRRIDAVDVALACAAWFASGANLLLGIATGDASALVVAFFTAGFGLRFAQRIAGAMRE